MDNVFIQNMSMQSCTSLSVMNKKRNQSWKIDIPEKKQLTCMYCYINK
jgi:hypothetical protein